ncbi:MAG: ubiquitin-like domain-containing protein [Frankiaceae bacterium]
MNGTRLAATATVFGLFGVAATGLAFAHPSKSATLSVDGRVEEVATTAGTVRALLKSRNIHVGSRDEVDPGLDDVIYAQERILVRRAWHLAVSADGVTKSTWTTADTVGAALGEMELKVGPYDKVSQPLTAGHKNMTVVIKRGKARDQTLTVTLAKPVKQVRDNSMTQGTTRVLKAGRAGTEQARLTRVYVDGKIDHVKVLGRRVTVKPVTEVVAIGTKAVAPPPSSPASPAASPASSAAASSQSSGPATAVPATMGSAWAKVGYCETGNNPTIVAGQFYGMYMMTQDAWRIAGGTGLPHQHSAAEQTMRAQILYNKLGSGPWPVCGKYLP